MSSTTETATASTASEPEPVQSLSVTSDEQTSSTSDSDLTPEVQPTPEDRARIPKQPMKEFKWGGDLIRKTLPIPTLPRWLDPLWVDIDDPTRLPLCWYGVPLSPKLVYGYAERKGLASYYTEEVGRFWPGDLDQFRTWANMQGWFERETGLKLDMNLVWKEDGVPGHALTFWSNHEMDNITTEMWGQACDLLDDMDYEEDDELVWYLDRSLQVRRLP